MIVLSFHCHLCFSLKGVTEVFELQVIPVRLILWAGSYCSAGSDVYSM